MLKFIIGLVMVITFTACQTADGEIITYEDGTSTYPYIVDYEGSELFQLDRYYNYFSFENLEANCKITLTTTYSLYDYFYFDDYNLRLSDVETNVILDEIKITFIANTNNYTTIELDIYDRSFVDVSVSCIP